MYSERYERAGKSAAAPIVRCVVLTFRPTIFRHDSMRMTRAHTPTNESAVRVVGGCPPLLTDRPARTFCIWICFSSAERAFREW